MVQALQIKSLKCNGSYHIPVRFLGCSGIQLDETREYARVPFSSVTVPKEKEFKHPVFPNCLFQYYIFSALLHLSMIW